MQVKNISDFNSRCIEFEYSMDAEYRKENGIYYTDADLSYAILKFLNLDTSKSFFEPNCGSGSFVFAAQKYSMENIYAADIDKNAVNLCRKLTGISKNIKALDTIWSRSTDILKKFNRNEKFDYIIGNPPYVPIDKNITVDSNDYFFLRSVKDSGSNLFVGSIFRALEMVSESGIISFIVPKNFLHVNSYKILRRNLLSEITIHSIINIGSHFKNVRGEQIVLTLINKKPAENKILFCKLSEKNQIVKATEIEQKFYNDEILFFDSEEDFKLYNKLESSYEKLDDICTGYVGRGRSKKESAISGKDIQKFGFKNKRSPKRAINCLFKIYIVQNQEL